MTPPEFWSATPREVAIVIEGARFRRDEAAHLALSTGWYAAAFERQQRLPSLERLLRKGQGGGGNRQSPEQILERLKQWHLALGGDPRELDKLQQRPPS